MSNFYLKNKHEFQLAHQSSESTYSYFCNNLNSTWYKGRTPSRIQVGTNGILQSLIRSAFPYLIAGAGVFIALLYNWLKIPPAVKCCIVFI